MTRRTDKGNILRNKCTSILIIYFRIILVALKENIIRNTILLHIIPPKRHQDRHSYSTLFTTIPYHSKARDTPNSSSLLLLRLLSYNPTRDLILSHPPTHSLTHAPIHPLSLTRSLVRSKTAQANLCKCPVDECDC